MPITRLDQPERRGGGPGAEAKLPGGCGAAQGQRGVRRPLTAAPHGNASRPLAAMACAQLLAMCLLPAKAAAVPRREPLPIFHDVSNGAGERAPCGRGGCGGTGRSRAGPGLSPAACRGAFNAF